MRTKWMCAVALVTNWHVLAGRNPATMAALDKDCAVPDEIIYPRFIKNDPYGEVMVKWFSPRLALIMLMAT
jgi:hypothetical protein